MIIAEIKMLTTLKGVKIDVEAQEVINIVETKIAMFEKSLNKHELDFLETVGVDRTFRPNKIKLPFLKLNAKVHKLNNFEIETKKVEKVSFRPVQDSSAFIMSQYATILMLLLRDLINAIKSKFNSIKNVDSLFMHIFL